MPVVLPVTPMPVMQWFADETGLPLTNGRVYTYLAGSTTPAATYSDPAGAVPNSNPLTLDENGKAVIYLGPVVYKFDVKSSTGVSLTGYPRDYIAGAAPPAQLTLTSTYFSSLNASALTNITGANVVGAVPLATLAADVSTVDVYLVAGQSNAQGQGVSATSVTVPTGKVLQWKSSAISDANDPVGNANTGSAWPNFGLNYYNATGRKILFVPAAVAGTTQVAAADRGNGNWDAGGTLWGLSVAAVTAAMAGATAAGYNPVFKGVLWCQGESDGDAINGVAPTTTQAAYQAALIAMILRYRTTYGAQMPFYIHVTGYGLQGAGDAGYALVRASQRIVRDSDTHTFIVFENAVDYPGLGLMQVDGYHYTQPGYNTMGQISAMNVISARAGSFLQHQVAGNLDLTYSLGGLGIGPQTPNGNLPNPNYKFQVRPATDQNFAVITKTNLADGISLISFTDSAAAQKSVELLASQFLVTTNAAPHMLMDGSGVLKLHAYTATTYTAACVYLVVDAAGIVKRSAIGPGS